MVYILMLFIGIAVGAIAVLLYGQQWHTAVKARERTAQAAGRRATEALVEANAKAADNAAAFQQQQSDFAFQSQQRWAEIEQNDQQRQAAFARYSQQKLAEITVQTDNTNRLLAEAQAKHDQLAARIISYRELQEENAILKRDLQNVDVNLHKLELDGEARDLTQAELTTRSNALAKRHLADNVKAVVAAVGPNNYAACKARLLDAIERVRKVGFVVTTDEEALLQAELREEFELAVRADVERQEQSRIKAQIREEDKLRREIERERQQQEREKTAVQAALDQALAEAHGQYSAEVERLQARLAEAEEKAKRTQSMAELTKTGHVYVISNLGAFGTDVYKIGMTRRLEPLDRVKELGDASVPFPFDVHMMIHSEDAPALENALHRVLHRRRVNRANPRKEFFRATLEEIVQIVRDNRGEVQYVADAAALEYRQSMAMSDADADFIEQVYEEAGGEDAVGDET